MASSQAAFSLYLLTTTANAPHVYTMYYSTFSAAYFLAQALHNRRVVDNMAAKEQAR